MSFAIVACASPNYAEVLRYCVPSWIKYAGASRIVIEQIGKDSDDISSWHMNLALRCDVIRDAVLEASKRKERILALDLDCVVLKGLSGGFSDNHAFSVARWPNVNMGVLFVNTAVAFPFKAFFDETCNRVRRQCTEAAAKPNARQAVDEQGIWQRMLHRRGKHVRRLDMNEWNFCYHPQDWDKKMGIHKDAIRIAHLKGRLTMRPAPLAALHKYFPEDF